MSKRCIKYKKRDNDGFTLVELMVVIVLIAILAAIAVPAFLSYLDKQKREQVIINAKDCLMSAQSLSTDQYVYGRPVYSSLDTLNTDVGKTTKLILTGENKEGEITYVKYGSKGKDLYTIHEFRYTENGITAIWKMEDAKWIYDDEVDIETLTGIVSVGESGSSGIVNNDIVIPVADKTPADNPGTNNPPAVNPPAEDPPVEDPPAEDPPAVNPPAEDPPAEDPPAEDPPAEEPGNTNQPGGNLVIVFNDLDVVTNVIIKDNDFWPDGQSIADAIAEAESNGDYQYQNRTINLKEGDVFIYNGIIYIVTRDQDVSYGNAKEGADAISAKWKMAYPIDTQNVLSKDDFQPWYDNRFVLINGYPGMLYYDDEEKLLFVTNREGGWYYLPTRYVHDGWNIVDDLTPDNG